MSDLCEQIRRRRDAILERFKAEVRRLALMPDLPEPTLVDDLDRLLDQLCQELDGRPANPLEPAAKHAEVRWESGVDVGAVVREFGVLAESIVCVVTDAGVPLSSKEQLAITSMVNRAAAASVRQYAQFRDKQYGAQYDALRRAEAMRDSIIMEAPLGVAFLDRELRFRLVNEPLARMNGLPRADHIGRTPADVLPDLPADALMAQARDMIETGAGKRDVQVVGETAAAPGEVRVWTEHWYPVRSGDEVIGVGVIVEEITERRRAEAFRERLLGVVSHDLRNPLNSIVMSANLVLMQPDVSQPVADFTRRVLSSARRMIGIVDQLYDYVSVDQGRGLPLARERIDLGALARRVAEECSLAFPGRPEVLLDLDGDLYGEWDEPRLAQVLSNLVGNAIQHGTGPATVALRGSRKTVRVEVRNRGAAMSQETLDTIFEPFKGAARKEHLGLGLFIAREIVRAHGGRIEATSSEMGGTVFAIELPRAA